MADPVGDLSQRAFDHIGRCPHPAVQGARRHPFGCRGPEPHGAFTAAHTGEAFALSARSLDDTSEPLHAQHRRRLGLPQEGRGAANILPTCPISWHGSPRPWVDLGACSPTPAGASDRHSNSVGGTTSALSRRAGDPRHSLRLRRSPELLGAHAELLRDLATIALDRLQGDRSRCVLEDPALDDPDRLHFA